MSLNEILKKASQEHWAVGHFNVSNLEQLKAVIEAAQELKSPVMIGTSEGERSWLGLAGIVAWVKAEKNAWPYIFLNADHTKSVPASLDAVEAGYDSVHFDGSALDFYQNIKETKEVVDYSKKINKEISVEGELGYIKGESQFTNKKINVNSSDYTDANQAQEFVKKTNVDRLAIAVGNIHGINIDEPRLDFERIAAIRKILPGNVILVLHAGSGIADSDIRQAIENGIANIHISTELRVVFRKSLEESLKQNPNEYSPYKLDKTVVEEMKNLVKDKIVLFNSNNRI